MSPKVIVYACPVGQLAQQLDQYFQKSHAACGLNAAHRYMPHCTLTGFFHDDVKTIPIYEDALTTTLNHHPCPPQPVVTITGMNFEPNFHYLKLASPWLIQLTANFAARVAAVKPNQPNPPNGKLRLKEWLHLSLAYEFNAKDHGRLKQLAETIVNPYAPVQWELRFYEQHADGDWTCHGQWRLY